MKLEVVGKTSFITGRAILYAMAWPLVDVVFRSQGAPERFNMNTMECLLQALRHDILEGDIGSSHVMEDAQGQLLLSGQREEKDRYRLDFTPYGLSSLIHGLDLAMEDFGGSHFQTLMSYPLSTIAALNTFLLEVSQDPTPRVLELPDLES